MRWKPKEKSWDWRECLTKDEAKVIAASDKAIQAIEKAREAHTKKYGLIRMQIVNRAIQRTKYRHTRPPAETAEGRR